MEINTKLSLLRISFDMRRIVAIGGVPGTGKTTLVREYMKGKDWVSVEPEKTLSGLYNKETDTYVLGKYEDGEVFAGTDRLSMAVQPAAQKFIKETKSNVLFEGDRLFNQSFLEFCYDLPNVDLTILLLEAPETLLKQRYQDRGSNQSDKFLQGRATKYNNIKNNLFLSDRVKTLNHISSSDTKSALSLIE